jgi:hypothetical protein
VPIDDDLRTVLELDLDDAAGLGLEIEIGGAAFACRSSAASMRASSASAATVNSFSSIACYSSWIAVRIQKPSAGRAPHILTPLPIRPRQETMRLIPTL